MRNIIRNVVIASAVTFASLGATTASANDRMIEFIMDAHDFTEYQQELAFELLASGRALAAEIKRPKEELKAYVAELIEKDQLDVEAMMLAYKSWQAGVDEKVLASLQSLAKLHSQLSKEQRQELMETFQKMRSK
ncbi:hypothetical protein P2G88_18650 [Aliiglaciecola sp. CAU 1673]|uniref:hypothetical protein n=1 Tax=Aliiglaciecola sp. CAU 1673 TaxID=3032595 RepID=UPI0023DBC24B|nr:hypothetical protein [Aliiglaciecola sp. CAU 1673]MDF2180281.1 hypothetical protein [Aliiglaciecola sp. CAU 1673]